MRSQLTHILPERSLCHWHGDEDEDGEDRIVVRADAVENGRGWRSKGGRGLGKGAIYLG